MPATPSTGHTGRNHKKTAALPGNWKTNRAEGVRGADGEYEGDRTGQEAPRGAGANSVSNNLLEMEIRSVGRCEASSPPPRVVCRREQAPGPTGGGLWPTTAVLRQSSTRRLRSASVRRSSDPHSDHTDPQTEHVSLTQDSASGPSSEPPPPRAPVEDGNYFPHNATSNTTTATTRPAMAPSAASLPPKMAAPTAGPRSALCFS
ncbi:unnamed protein product [Pleuronectes platessa]|uniref:Uncharacterized protein n=1 Tax=Pleuronectes platessa TaxID=8262 RepID=A0A9N7UTI0_PLEPL|nr:unnamed protein product [Pleuronectes platessa]